MKIASLISKLNKMNVSHSIVEYTEINHAISFTIKGRKFEASFTTYRGEIECFSEYVGYDQANQEGVRNFYYTFSHLLKNVNR